MQNKLLLHESLENLDLPNDLLLPFLQGTLILNLVVAIRLLGLLLIVKQLEGHGLIKELIKAAKPKRSARSTSAVRQNNLESAPELLKAKRTSSTRQIGVIPKVVTKKKKKRSPTGKPPLLF